MRLDLGDGQWAELRERISHGADKRIRLTRRRGRDDDEALLNVDDVLIREFVTAWYVLDVDGSPIALGDADATERLPERIADLLAVEAGTLYVGVTVPNSPTPS